MSTAQQPATFQVAGSSSQAIWPEYRRHISASKAAQACFAANLGFKEIHVESRPGDVMAGAGGACNSTPTIPHKYSQHKRSSFPVGTCDTAAADGRRGSNVYEVNPWLWQFGRGKPRLGGLSVEKTDDKKEAALKEQSLCGAETRRRRKADWA